MPRAVIAEDEALLRDDLVLQLKGAWPEQIPFFPLEPLRAHTDGLVVAESQPGLMVAALLTWTDNPRHNDAPRSETPATGIAPTTPPHASDATRHNLP